jgi:hypothetical protein
MDLMNLNLKGQNNEIDFQRSINEFHNRSIFFLIVEKDNRGNDVPEKMSIQTRIFLGI